MKISEFYEQFVQDRVQNNLYRKLKVLSHTSSRIVEEDRKPYINFSSNDYLGLRFHPEIIRDSLKMTERYGCGSGSSRLVSGNFDYYLELENQIAQWKGFDSCLIMGSGFDCNISVLASIFNKDVLQEKPLVFTDKLMHASMHAGCQLAGVNQIRFKHNDMKHLSHLLDQYAESTQPKFILTESVFSMDGDIAPLNSLYKLRDTHKALLIVDEAHATGVFGDHGQGLASKADIVIGTFGKALGGFGSYVVCSKSIRDFLIQHCAGLIYSTGLPPGVLGSIRGALRIAPEMHDERLHLKKLANYFREKMAEIENIKSTLSESQIVPLMLCKESTALRLSHKLKEKGFMVPAIRPPTVPKGTSRLRFSLCTFHTYDDIDQIILILSDDQSDGYL